MFDLDCSIHAPAPISPIIKHSVTTAGGKSGDGKL